MLKTSFCVVFTLIIGFSLLKAEELKNTDTVLEETLTKKQSTESATPKSTKNKNEEYHEELVVQPLASGFINTYFQFTTRWSYGQRKNCKYIKVHVYVLKLNNFKSFGCKNRT